MTNELRRKVVAVVAAGTVAAAGMVSSLVASATAGASASPRRAPGCSWPASSEQVASALGVKVKATTSEGGGYSGQVGSFALCAYVSNDGVVALYYYSGITTKQFFQTLEAGIARSKHLHHTTTVSGLGSEAFYATSGHQTFLFVHVGSTAVFVFANRPPAKVIGLARLIASQLPKASGKGGGMPTPGGSGGSVTVGTKLPADFPKAVPLPSNATLVGALSMSSTSYELWFAVTGSQANVFNSYKSALGKAGFAIDSSGGEVGSTMGIVAKSSSWAVDATVLAQGTVAGVSKNDFTAGQVEMALIVG